MKQYLARHKHTMTYSTAICSCTCTCPQPTSIPGTIHGSHTHIRHGPCAQMECPSVSIPEPYIYTWCIAQPLGCYRGTHPKLPDLSGALRLSRVTLLVCACLCLSVSFGCTPHTYSHSGTIKTASSRRLWPCQNHS